MRNEFKVAALALGLTAPWMLGTAHAADLGGDCCADLEERVAELEATTVRKGNRKVSVKLSGHVAAIVLFWDDGEESNTYVTNSGPAETRFRLTGNAKITSDWSAGYQIEIGVRGQPSPVSVDQDNDNAGATGLGVRKSEMYLKSATYGQLSWGHTSSSLDDLTHYGTLMGYYDQADWNWYSSFNILTNGVDSGLNVGTLASRAFDGRRINGIRYDTPTIAGFKLSTSWGEDDYWDVALRYAGDLGDFKVKAAVGYSEDTDGSNDDTGAPTVDTTKASALIWHTPTGLFVDGAYNYVDTEGPTVDHEGFIVRGGIKKKFNPLGYTTVWGSYGQYDDLAVATGATFGGNAILDSEASRWGVGVVQDIDAAAMSLFIMYQNAEFEAETIAGDADLDDFDAVIMGGYIKF